MLELQELEYAQKETRFDEAYRDVRSIVVNCKGASKKIPSKKKPIYRQIRVEFFHLWADTADTKRVQMKALLKLGEQIENMVERQHEFEMRKVQVRNLQEELKLEEKQKRALKVEAELEAPVRKRECEWERNWHILERGVHFKYIDKCQNGLIPPPERFKYLDENINDSMILHDYCLWREYDICLKKEWLGRQKSPSSDILPDREIQQREELRKLEAKKQELEPRIIFSDLGGVTCYETYVCHLPEKQRCELYLPEPIQWELYGLARVGGSGEESAGSVARCKLCVTSFGQLC